MNGNQKTEDGMNLEGHRMKLKVRRQKMEVIKYCEVEQRLNNGTLTNKMARDTMPQSICASVCVYMCFGPSATSPARVSVNILLD